MATNDIITTLMMRFLLFLTCMTDEFYTYSIKHINFDFSLSVGH